MKLKFLTLTALAATLSVSAEIPLDYYAPADGLCGAPLKEALRGILNDNVKMLSYGSGDFKTWWAFYYTDVTDDAHVRDRYSADVFNFGDRGASVANMNIEHSFPKSWWGGAENNAYKDLFNLMPCQTTINNHKSNYPMAVVDNVWRTNGVTKVGTRQGDADVTANRFWEPADNWKGDFARGYMYMATAYGDFTWSGDQSPRILQTGTYPTLQPWASTLYMQWSEADEVDPIETARVDMVERLQGNRNPFVDFPNLHHYIWGDSIDTPFNPLTSVKSALFSGGASIIAKQQTVSPVEIYANSFMGDKGGCIAEAAPGSDNVTVWTNTADYGWKGNAAKGSSTSLTRYATDVTLYTPAIDLSGYNGAWMHWEHAVNYNAAPFDDLSVVVRPVGEGSATPVAVHRWPVGNVWTFFRSTAVDLTPFAGKKVQVGFRYTSTPDKACTWEVKSLSVKGVKLTSSIHSVSDDAVAADTPAEYYTVDGRGLTSLEGYRGIVIIRQGNKITKTVIK